MRPLSYPSTLDVLGCARMPRRTRALAQLTACASLSLSLSRMCISAAFWTFATLMQHCGLAGLFTDGFAHLHLCYDAWQALLKKQLPRLSSHIAKELLGFLGMSEAEYKQLVKEHDPQRIMLPSMCTRARGRQRARGGGVVPPCAPPAHARLGVGRARGVMHSCVEHAHTPRACVCAVRCSVVRACARQTRRIGSRRCSSVATTRRHPPSRRG